MDASAHFFRLPFSPASLFPHDPGSRYFSFFFFFSVESTPENSRRHLVARIINYRVAAHGVSDPDSISVSLIRVFFSVSLGLEFRHTYARIRTYVCTVVAIVAFRALDCSTRTKRGRLHCVAWRTASRRVGSARVRWVGRGRWDGGRVYRITSTWKRRAHYVGGTILRDSMKLLLSETPESRAIWPTFGREDSD